MRATVLKLVLPLVLPLSVNAMQHLEAKHRLLFEEVIEPGKRWVYEIEIDNRNDGPLDQIELTLPGTESISMIKSQAIHIDSFEANSKLVVHWLLETTDLNYRPEYRATQPLFFTGTALDAGGESADVEMMSQPDTEWLEHSAVVGVGHD